MIDRKMGKYRIDVHVHTGESSPCARARGAEAVKIYKELGYDGIVITDHYSVRFFLSAGFGSWESKMKKYLSGFYEACRAGKEIGLDVFLGKELAFTWSLNDYLVYGIDEEFLFEHRNLHRKGLKNFRKIADRYGYLIYQAHPFRMGMTRANPALLDGVEVYNAHPRHNSNNDLADKFAKENNLKRISGSDFHRVGDAGRGGLILPEKPADNKMLLEMLREERIEALITSE